MARYCFAFLVAALLCGGSTAAGQTPGRDNRALLIGIGNYPNYPASERLRYAASDADKLRTLVDNGWLGRFSTVQVLREQEASSGSIMSALTELASAPRGRVLIFFAGHGLQNSRGTTYLMPWEGHPDTPEKTGIGAAEFAEAVKRITASELLIFVDACNSGALGAFLGEGLRNAGRIDHQVGLFAASADARSYEQSAAEGGVFTYALRYAIGGAGDVNQDKKTTATELADYVERQVYTLVSEGIPVPGLRQRPVRSAVFDGSLVVAVPPAPRPVTGPPSPPSAPGWLRIPQYAGPISFFVTGITTGPDVELTLTDRADDTMYRVALKGGQEGAIERLAPGTYTVVAQSAGREVYRGTLVVPLGQGAAVARIDGRSATTRVSYEGGLQIR